MQFIIMLVLILITELLRPVPAPPARPGLGDFQAPTASQDRRIPVFWGKPWLKGPNLVWYGDLRIRKIVVKIKGMFTSKKQTIGYKYFIGMHLVFGHGGENLRILKIDVDGDIVWSGDSPSGTYRIDKDGLWGGDGEGGGMSGTFTFMGGERTQGQNSYLSRVLGPTLPAYRGLAGITWNRGYHGTQTVLKSWSAQIQNLPALLGTGFHNIAGEANGADIQFVLLTNNLYGMGITADEIDVTAFRACAAKVHAEGLGLSLIWDNAKSLEEIMKEVDRHLDSVTYQDPLTGLWTMKLIREDYDISTLLRANPSNANLVKFSRPTADELVNEVKVVYSSEEYNGAPLPVQVQDLAAYQNRDNQKISIESSYAGFTKTELANRVASRDLRATSYPFARVQLKVDRRFYRVRPVDRIVLDWPPLGIENMVLIVIERDLGTMADGSISLTCVQDVFGVGEALYSEGGNSSGWVPVGRDPIPPTVYRMEFSPYWLNQQDESIPSAEAAVPMLMVESPGTSHLSYELQYTDPSLGGVFTTGDEAQPFTPTATLVYDYLESLPTDTSGTLILKDLTTVVDIPVGTAAEVVNLGTGLVIIDGEWLAFTSAIDRPDGTFAITGVRRGLMDSVPARHTAGSKVWFVGSALGRTPTQLTPFAAGTYQAKLITRALGGALNPAAAPTVAITSNGSSVNARPLYAYPVRYLTLNGSPIPGKVTGNSLSLAWKHSNKGVETSLVFQDGAESVKPGDTHYIAYLYSDAGVQLAKSGNLFGASHTFAVGDVVGGLPQSGYVQVETVNSVGASARATLWFGRDVDYPNTQDAGPQRLLDEAGPWTFIRMAD